MWLKKSMYMSGSPMEQLKMGFDFIWEGFIDYVLCVDWRTDGFGGLSKSVISVLFYRYLKTIAKYVKEKIWRFIQKDSQHEKDNKRDQSLSLSPCLPLLRTDHPCIPTSAWPVNECGYMFTAAAMSGLPGPICQCMWVMSLISPETVHSYAVIGLEPRQLQDLNLKLAFNA